MAEFGKLPFQVAFDPTTGFILDARQFFTSFADAEKAAKSAKEMGSKETVYYYGMQLLVDDGTNVTWYQITRSNTLRVLASGDGTAGSSDLPQVTLDDEGKILTVVGGKWTAAELPRYDGEYVVEASAASDQTLNTGSKFVDSNITIRKVPYSEVSNTSNGTTVTIGGN